MPGPELVAGTIADLAVKPRREVIVPFKYHAVIWLDRLLPGIADRAFSMRNRRHGTQGTCNDNLPSYARTTERTISEQLLAGSNVVNYDSKRK
jgi:hypothetical protein